MTDPLGNPVSNSSNPPYHTFSNGPNWLEFLTDKYNQSVIETYNLAISGSVVNSTIFHSEPTSDLVHQIRARFVPNYATRDTAGWTSSNSLFTIFIGINDANRAWSQSDDGINGLVIRSYKILLNQVMFS